MHPDGRIGTCVAGRVITDDHRGLLMWIDPQAHLTRRAMLDGKPTRSLSYAAELRTPTIPTLTYWHPNGGALVLTPDGAAHSVLWFFDLEGSFSGWYVNLEAPARRWFGGVDIHDKALDVLIAPDRTWEWKDEDEFAALTGHPLLWDKAEAAEIRAEGERVIALAEAGNFPFDGTWCDFRPDPAWPPSTLPWWWDVTP